MRRHVRHLEDLVDLAAGFVLGTGVGIALSPEVEVYAGAAPTALGAIILGAAVIFRHDRL